VRLALYTERHNLLWDLMAPMWREADQIPAIESAWTFDHLHVYPTQFSPARNDAEASLGRTRSHVGIAREVASRLRHVLRDRREQAVGPCLEGWIALTALLALTTRIRGGVLVTGMFYRHPAVLAQMVASLDIISAGRLEIGVGPGWSEAESAAYGLELGTWPQRFERFEEGMHCLVGLMSNDTTTFDGKYFQLNDALCEPKPFQRPHPPICIAGAGERRTIPAVARWADTWQAGFDLAALPRKREVLVEECGKIGRDPAEITTAMLLTWNGRSRRRLADHLGRFQEAGVDLAMISIRDNDPRLLDGVVHAFADGVVSPGSRHASTVAAV
jgi:alkanesulfonate monooxygenase SsuD/methylene tetrahydromethanopterin reductase-like flavin-dependent oxidoreductase (luciferase family)